MLPFVAMSTQPLALDLRRAPSQERSRATFDAILQTAAEILEQRGLHGFNTNLLSERTGVSVRAIYRYFPNKHALVIELARRMEEAWREALADGLALADPETDWRAAWCGYIDGFVAAVRRTPGAVAILQAMRVDPDLRAVDDEANAQYVRDVAGALCERDPRILRTEARATAAVLIESAVGVVNAALEESPARSARMIDLLKQMQLALLEVTLREQ
jgi:AcrR family transcriptional regulator